MMKSPQPPVVSIINLGCQKNTVDTERLLAHLAQSGLLLSHYAEESDVCLVNTCGFIESARSEVQENIEGLVALRQRYGKPKLIVALGCLVASPHPFPHLNGADQRVHFRDYLKLPDLIRQWLFQPHDEIGSCVVEQCPSSSPHPPAAFPQLPRLLTASPHSVHLKIAEGCSHRCSYCSIPLLRGAQVSRPPEDILQEARQLIEAGAREINLIAQDTTAYGRDLPAPAPRLPTLLPQLLELSPAPAWFRLMYLYPNHVTDELLACFQHPRMTPYIDLPLQHVHADILKSMNRPGDPKSLARLLDRIRDHIPRAALRTTFILGYPLETETHFHELLRFVQQHEFDHLGAFIWSPEPGTRAAAMPDETSQEEKADRLEQLMHLQQGISRRKLRERIGTTTSVMIDAPAERGETKTRSRKQRTTQVLARTSRQAPEVDGITRVRIPPRARVPTPGTICQVTITDADTYDLYAKLKS